MRLLSYFTYCVVVLAMVATLIEGEEDASFFVRSMDGLFVEDLSDEAPQFEGNDDYTMDSFADSMEDEDILPNKKENEEKMAGMSCWDPTVMKAKAGWITQKKKCWLIAPTHNACEIRLAFSRYRLQGKDKIVIKDGTSPGARVVAEYDEKNPPPLGSDRSLTVKSNRVVISVDFAAPRLRDEPRPNVCDSTLNVLYTVIQPDSCGVCGGNNECKKPCTKVVRLDSVKGGSISNKGSSTSPMCWVIPKCKIRVVFSKLKLSLHDTLDIYSGTEPKKANLLFSAKDNKKNDLVIKSEKDMFIRFTRARREHLDLPIDAPRIDDPDTSEYFEAHYESASCSETTPDPSPEVTPSPVIPTPEHKKHKEKPCTKVVRLDSVKGGSISNKGSSTSPMCWVIPKCKIRVVFSKLKLSPHDTLDIYSGTEPKKANLLFSAKDNKKKSDLVIKSEKDMFIRFTRNHDCGDECEYFEGQYEFAPCGETPPPSIAPSKPTTTPDPSPEVTPSPDSPPVKTNNTLSTAPIPKDNTISVVGYSAAAASGAGLLTYFVHKQMTGGSQTASVFDADASALTIEENPLFENPLTLSENPLYGLDSTLEPLPPADMSGLPPA